MKHSVIVRSLTAISMIALGLAVTALPASAEPGDEITTQAVVCDNKGKSWFEWTGINSPGAITHATRYVNNTGEIMQGTLGAQYQTTIGAELTSTAGSGISGSIVVASLDAQTSLSLKVYGSKTTTTSVQVNIVIPTGKVSIAFAGTTAVRGSYKYQYCNASGTMQTKQSGKAQSWNVMTFGGVRCDINPGDKLSIIAKSRFC
jgi:hypothetical protein